MGIHKTSCWMGPLSRGTDEDRAALMSKIRLSLISNHGNLNRAAVALGVHVATLRRYVYRLGLGELVQAARSTPSARADRVQTACTNGAMGGRPRKES